MNSLNFNHLFYFWVVSRFESLAKAASELKISSPSLSIQIKQLEETIGDQLFIRTGRSLKLSGQGKLLKNHCDKIFLQYDQLDKIIKEGKALGHNTSFNCGVSVNISKHLEYLFLSEILSNEINCKVSSAENSSLIDDLLNFKLDFLLTNTLSFRTQEDLKVYKLHESPYVIAHSTKQQCQEDRFMLQSAEALKMSMLKDAVYQFNPQAQIKSIIDDTSLARLFAKKSCAYVVMPKIGLFDEILNGEITIVEELDITESYYLITTQQMSKLLDFEYYLTEFRNKYTEI